MRLRFYTYCLSFLLAVLAFAQVSQSEEQLNNPPMQPHYKIGIITDGPLLNAPGAAESFRKEIKQIIAEEEFSVSFPQSMRLKADGTVLSINQKLDNLLENPETDLIITLGAISSTEALKRQNPTKPIVAPVVIDAKLQKAPRQDYGSGIPNLTYVDLKIPMEYELMAFRRIVPFERLAILLDERDITGVPEIQRFLKTLKFEHSIDIDLIPVGISGSAAVHSIPTQIDAVMVGPLWQLTPEEFSQLTKNLIDRKLPSFAMWDHKYVQQGLFATNMPANTFEHLARKVAIIVQEIFLGEDISRLPVAFSKSKRLAINMATARAISVYPSLAEMVGAELLNEQRKDIERRLTLGEAVQTALHVNLDLAIAEKRVIAGSHAVGEARSPLLPQLSIGAGGRIIDDDRAALGGGTAPEEATLGNLTASQIIYSDDAWTGYTVEKYLQSGREYDRDSVRLDIIFDTSVAYLNVLRQKTIEQLQKDNMQLTQANLDRAQIRLSSGVAGPDEVYRWETQFANDRQLVLSAESATLDAMQGLNRILNRPMQEEFIAEETDLSDPLLITGSKLFYELMHNPIYLRGFNAFAINEGTQASPELKALDTAIAAQERIILQSRRDFWVPTVSLEGSVDQYFSTSGEGKRNEDLTGLDDTDWSVGIVATLPLFEGGKRSSTLARTKEELLQLQTQHKATEERISQRILKASNNTRASYPSIYLSRDAADSARLNLQLVTDSYVQGIKSIIELLDAQNQALNSDLAAANAVYDFLIDYMGVQRSIGEFITYLPADEQQAWLERAKDFIQGKGK